MTARDHAPVYTSAPDPYEKHRRPCGHLVYRDEARQDPCRWDCPPPAEADTTDPTTEATPRGTP